MYRLKKKKIETKSEWDSNFDGGKFGGDEGRGGEWVHKMMWGCGSKGQPMCFGHNPLFLYM